MWIHDIVAPYCGRHVLCDVANSAGFTGAIAITMIMRPWPMSFCIVIGDRT